MRHWKEHPVIKIPNLARTVGANIPFLKKESPN